MRKIYLSVILSLFVVVLMAQNKINQYEYWFDGNYASKITTDITPVINFQLNTQIATTGLTTGLHVIHVRFRDDSLKYSSVVSQFFYKMDAAIPTTNALLVSCEYWFDDNYANKISSSFSGSNGQEQLISTIATGSLGEGLHVFHIRFKDNNNKWSSVLSQFFYKHQPQAGSPTSLLSEYEYWFDNDHANKVSNVFSATNTQENVISAITTGLLNTGLHVFHIRFRDTNNKWSSVLSQFFYKQSSASASANSLLTAYEYWFDNDYATKVLTSFSGTNAQEDLISGINTSAITGGLHTFHIRFKDNNNKWSLVLSQFFYKMTDQALINNNFMTAYRYWFDSDESAINHIYFSAPSSQINVIENIDLTHLWKGSHTIHFQFKDTFDIWSVVTNDTVVKEALPVASFFVDDTTVCIGDTISFISHSVDGDAHVWDFGDGNFSSDSLTIHAYSTPGVYSVSLTVNDTLSGRDSTITQQIIVTGYPVATINIVGNDTLCQGQNTQLDIVTSNASIVWNTTETTSSINVGSQGDYYALVTSLNNSSCAISSDTITIVVNPLPIVSLGNDTSICEGNDVVLDATNLNATYLWNTGAQTATIIVVQTNQYSVTVTNQFACSQSDTIDITVNPLPVADFSYTINDQTVTFTNNSQYGTSFAWDFGDGNTSNSPSPTNTFPATGGTFSVQMTVTNACGSDVFTQNVTVQPNSIYENDFENFEVDVFPNPAIDRININVTLDAKSNLKVNIYDYTGKLVDIILDENRPKGMQYICYNTQQLNSGAYFIEISNSQNKVVKKLIVSK